MRKYILALCVVLGLLSTSSALALSESDYREMLKDSEFAAADRELRQAWNDAKRELAPEKFEALKQSQREWVKSVRDEAAEELMDFLGYSRVMAYIAVTTERVKVIRAFLAKSNTISPKPGFIVSIGQFTCNLSGQGRHVMDCTLSLELIDKEGIAALIQSSIWITKIRSEIFMLIKDKIYDDFNSSEGLLNFANEIKRALNKILPKVDGEAPIVNVLFDSIIIQ